MYTNPSRAWDKQPERIASLNAMTIETYQSPPRTPAYVLSLLQELDHGVVIIDANGFIEEINPAAERIIGRSRDEVCHRPLEYQIVFQDDLDAERFSSSLNAVLRPPARNSDPLVCFIGDRDGKARPVEFRFTSCLNDDQSIGQVLLLITDLTEKQTGEQNLLKMAQLESLGLLAGGIAHDFNNILIGILGNIELAMKTQNPAETAHLLMDAENATLRAKDLSRQLLSLSKGGSADKRPIHPGSYLIEAATFALHGARARCDFHIDDALWPVDADIGQIERVIQNLVINADQAMPYGGVITLSARNIHLEQSSAKGLSPGKYVRISVADEGPGIAPEAMQRIFEPYFTTKEKGTGLGLSTSQAIINRHNGYLEVESEPGVGATFSFYLPASDRPLPLSPTMDSDDLPDSEGDRILIMDDEEVIQELIGRMLEDVGYEVGFASDGRAAIATYKEAMESGNPFDVVIMDLTIPGGMGGKDAIQELLIIHPNARGIVSSGYPNDPVMENYREYGFVYAIPKPYKFKELHRILQMAIHSPAP